MKGAFGFVKKNEDSLDPGFTFNPMRKSAPAYTPPVAQQIPRDNRVIGVGNNDMFRRGFREPEVMPRLVTDNMFGLSRRMDERDNGTIVQISGKTLGQNLFTIFVPDEKDVTFSAENRKQRTIAKKVDVGDASLAMSEKMAVLAGILENGATSTSTLLGSLVKDIASMSSNLSPSNLATLASGVTALKIPDDYKSAGLNRFYTKKEYAMNPGPVNLYALHKNMFNDLNTPFKSAAGFPTKLQSFLGNWKSQDKVLDLETMSIVDVNAPPTSSSKIPVPKKKVP